jgi:class 3 adenylate cyclase
MPSHFAAFSSPFENQVSDCNLCGIITTTTTWIYRHLTFASSFASIAQVFTLLETIFHAFDDAAKRRRVYKVETVGDCYVAVTGLPEPRSDHAVAMCRFAKECLKSFHRLSRQLETKLGPDTADLDLRVGMHSGQVTGGVLRGERSRFQLFGDTMVSLHS